MGRMFPSPLGGLLYVKLSNPPNGDGNILPIQTLDTLHGEVQLN